MQRERRRGSEWCREGEAVSGAEKEREAVSGAERERQ